MINEQFYDKYLIEIETLQEQLIELNEDDIEVVNEKIFLLIFNNINENTADDQYRSMFFKSFTRHLIISSKTRPTKIKLLANIISSIFSREEIANSTKLIFYKTIILTTLFNSIKNDLTLSSQCTIVCLLHHFVKNGFFKMSQILTLYKNEKVTQNKGKKALFTVFFCWFAPLIEKEDRKLFCEMNENVFHFHDDINFGHSFKIFFDNIQKLREDDWKLFNEYIQIEQNVGTVNAAIKNDDDANYLRDLCANPDFKFSLTPVEDDSNRHAGSSIIEPSIFEPSFIVQDRPTLIQFAAFFGALKCFNFILQAMNRSNNFLREIQDEKKRDLVVFAVAGGNVEIVRLCEQNGLDLSHALPVATEFFQHDIFAWIVDSYDLDSSMSEDSHGFELTDIFCKAAASNNIKIVKWCINEKHVDANRKSIVTGMSPLLVAAESGSYESFVLIAKCCPGVDLNVKDSKYNKNSLHFACEHNHSEIVEFLLTFCEQKIDHISPGFRNMNVFCLACKNGCVTSLRALLRYVPEDDLEVLLNSHADYSLATPLHLACWHGHKEIVNILIHEEKVEIVSFMDDNRTPLHIAAENRHSEIVSLLVEKEKMLINMKDRSGYTALHLAACNNDVETVKVLLNTGLCNVNLCEKVFFFFLFFN